MSKSNPEIIAAITAAVREAMPVPQPEWLTTAEAATYIRIHRETLGKWRIQNKGPPVHRLSPRMYRYKRAELDAYLSSFPNSENADDE